MQHIITQHDEVLNSAVAGAELAAQVESAIAASDRVILDLSNVRRVTPSFANAFVMNVLEVTRAASLSSVVDVQSNQPIVLSAFADAESRYQRGIRLSSQRPVVTT